MHLNCHTACYWTLTKLEKVFILLEEKACDRQKFAVNEPLIKTFSSESHKEWCNLCVWYHE